MARIKGIVMENNNGQAVILTSQGEFQRIKIDEHLEVGELYYGRSISPWKYLLAATFILALTLGAIDYFSVKVYAQVSPSLELGINRWNRVVQVRALDAKGEEILEESNYIGRKVDDVAESIADQALANGYIEEDSLTRNFPVQASDKGNKDEEFIQRVEQNMNQGIQKAIEKNKSKADKKINKSQGEENNGKNNR